MSSSLQQLNDDAEVKKLLEENQYYLRLLVKSMEKTRRYIMWGRIISAVYLLLFVAPIIFAIIYLPPLIGQVVKPYQDLLGGGSGPSQQIDPELFNKAADLLKNYQ